MKKISILFLLLCLIVGVSIGLLACDNKDIQNEKELVSISVESVPDYIFIGELDNANIMLQLNYSDNTKDTIVIRQNMLGSKYVELLNTVGVHDIEILYRGKAVSFLLKVVEKYYTVIWKDYDGTILKIAENVEYGTIPSFGEEEPTRNATAQYSYEFTGWSPTIEQVNKNTEYTAMYNSKINKYTVTWKNYDGTVLKTVENVEYGTMPSFGEEEPTRNATEQYSYTFSKWSPAIDIVTCDIDYVAEYTETTNEVEVKFYNANNKLISVQSVPYGGSAVEPDQDERRVCGYLFASWDKDFTNVISSIKVYGFYVKINGEEYTVSYNLDEGINNINNTTVYYELDEDISLFAPTKKGYTFDGWYSDSEFNTQVENIPSGSTGDIELFAKWLINTYTITYQDYKDSIKVVYDLNYTDSDEIVEYYTNGEAIEDKQPTRDNYIFRGWYLDKELTDRFNFDTNLTEDITLFAGWQEMTVLETMSEYQIVKKNCGTGFSTLNHTYCYKDHNDNLFSYLFYDYFTAVDENFTLNISCNSSQLISIKIYNLTTGTILVNSSTVVTGNGNERSLELNCTIGDVICIESYMQYANYTKNYLGTFEMLNYDLPENYSYSIINDTYLDGADTIEQITYNGDFTLPIPTRSGYRFWGWYIGEEKVESGIFDYDDNITLISKWGRIIL